MADAKITDDGLAALRARIGIAAPQPGPPHYRRPSDRCLPPRRPAYGDDNPLWCDPDYAAATRWGGPIAPPPLVGGDSLIGEDELTEAELAGGSGELQG